MNQSSPYKRVKDQEGAEKEEKYKNNIVSLFHAFLLNFYVANLFVT